jgi:hypothetical protein
MIVVGVVGAIAVQLTWIVITQLHELGITDDRWWFSAFAETTNVIALGFAVVAAVGAWRCVADSTPPARQQYAAVVVLLIVGHAGQFVPWLLSLVTDPSWTEILWLQRLVYVAGVAGVFVYALAAKQLANQRALVHSLQVAVVLEVTSSVMSIALGDGPFAQPSAVLRIVTATLTLCRQIAWLYVALDVLGAFASSNEAPRATVHVLPRRVAGGAAGALCLIGIGLASFALWGTRLVSSGSTTDRTLVLGLVAFVCGAFALASMRRRVPIAVPCAAAAVLIAGGMAVTRANVTPLERMALVAQHLPGLTISLPDGTVDRAVFTRELGQLTVMTYHSDIGLVTLSWRRGQRSPLEGADDVHSPQIADVPFDEQVHGLTIHGVVLSGSNIAQLHVTWRCPDDGRWFKLEVSRYEAGVDVLRGVGHRIFETIACSDRSDAPPFTLAFTPPAGYVAKPWPSGEPLRWTHGDAELFFYWSADEDLVATLSSDPGALLDVVSWRQHADEVAWLPDEVMAKRGDIVESDTRKVAEVVASDYRVIMTAWRCWGLEIDVVGMWTGPASLPCEAALDALRSARCPH